MRIKNIHFFILLISILVSCKSEEVSNPEVLITPKDEQMAKRVLEVDRLINELEFIARNIKFSYPNQPGILSGTTITAGKTDEQKIKYTIVFDDKLGEDNKRRNGKLTVVFEDATENGNLVVGKHLHVRSDDENELYTVGEVKFKGSLVFSNIAAARHASDATINHLNAQSFIIKQDGEEVKFSSVRKSKWIAGKDTPDFQDDIFEIFDQSYTLSAKTSITDFIEAKSVSPSLLNYSCRGSLFAPKKGILKVEHVGGNTRFIHLGNGNCSDNPVIRPTAS